jgi:thiol-disulfide isomerase/thioredoxin
LRSLHCRSSFASIAQPSNPQSNPAVRQKYDLGRAALDAGKNKDALEAFKQAASLANGNCAECYLGMAVVYIRAQMLPEVLANCDKALGYAADNSLKATALVLKGKALMSISPVDDKRIPQAEQAFRDAITLVGKDPVAHFDLALALLRQNKDDQAKVELQQCLGLHPPSQIADEAQKLLDHPQRARQDIAPEFKLATLQGQEVSLQDLQGKIVVLDFWATWCPPCRESVGELKDLTKKYPVDKVVLISISVDENDAAWRKFVADKKMMWLQYRDADGKMQNSYGVHSFPTYMVIDGEGVMRQRLSGLNPQQTVVHRLKETLAAMPQLEGGGGK